MKPGDIVEVDAMILRIIPGGDAIIVIRGVYVRAPLVSLRPVAGDRKEGKRAKKIAAAFDTVFQGARRR